MVSYEDYNGLKRRVKFLEEDLEALQGQLLDLVKVLKERFKGEIK